MNLCFSSLSLTWWKMAFRRHIWERKKEKEWTKYFFDELCFTLYTCRLYLIALLKSLYMRYIIYYYLIKIEIFTEKFQIFHPAIHTLFHTNHPHPISYVPSTFNKSLCSFSSGQTYISIKFKRLFHFIIKYTAVLSYFKESLVYPISTNSTFLQILTDNQDLL